MDVLIISVFLLLFGSHQEEKTDILSTDTWVFVVKLFSLLIMSAQEHRGLCIIMLDKTSDEVVMHG